MKKLLLFVCIVAILIAGFFLQQSISISQTSSVDCPASGVNCHRDSGQLAHSETNAIQHINTPVEQPKHLNVTVADSQDEQLNSLVDQNYNIVFSYLSLSAETQQALRELLREREKIAGGSYYDARSNEAEIAANLRDRETAIAAVDKKIGLLLGEKDAHTFDLLKDSHYEQSQLARLDELSGEQNSISPDAKKVLLLSMLEKKQNFKTLISQADAEIENAAEATKPFLIKNLQQKLRDAQKSYLLSAQNRLDSTQFDLLNADEQQEFNEQWRVLSSHWE